MNILVVTGSISEQSNNRRIARWFDKHYGERVDLKHLPLVLVPMFNQDIEENPPAEVQDMRRLFKEADGVVMIAPEYNHSIPGVLKNLLDWTSRVEPVLKDKPVFVLGGSTGRFGTLRGQIHLTQILNSPGIGAKLFGRQVQVDLVDQKFTPEGDCTDERMERSITRAMEAFLASING